MFTALAAYYWYRSASVQIRNALDYMIPDLWRAGILNSMAAKYAGAAAISQIFATLCRIGQRAI